MRDTAPRMPEIPDLELAQLLAAQCVVKQRGKNGAVALFLDGFVAGSC